MNKVHLKFHRVFLANLRPTPYIYIYIRVYNTPIINNNVCMCCKKSNKNNKFSENYSYNVACFLTR